jgi:hypothetical protein
MGKYSDYTDAAIGMEGSDNWPSYWKEDCDESFKEYKKQINAGKNMDVETFLDRQKVIFSNMTKTEKERCYVYTKTPKTPKKMSKKRTLRKNRQFKHARNQLNF